ncbi:conserved hypothetical protein [uncultured Mycobacterium sp.]|uniref:Uncharacterized protein n=1 Tax=uncultured Mycobacterium sp. TaxID=171292 RepID=A0A1Y5PFJ4_9MYCO|nr:conserved hypothetical protein [uncultured Mycobacterium sp.]
MTAIDYALAYAFVDPTEPRRKYRLSFDTDDITGGDRPELTNPLGRVVAVVVNPGKPDNYAQYPISRAHIHYNDAEAAVTGTGWPWLERGRTINLAAIRDRLHQSQLT